MAAKRKTPNRPLPPFEVQKRLWTALMALDEAVPGRKQYFYENLYKRATGRLPILLGGDLTDPRVIAERQDLADKVWLSIAELIAKHNAQVDNARARGAKDPGKRWDAGMYSRLWRMRIPSQSKIPPYSLGLLDKYELQPREGLAELELSAPVDWTTMINSRPTKELPYPVVVYESPHTLARKWVIFAPYEDDYVEIATLEMELDDVLFHRGEQTVFGRERAARVGEHAVGAAKKLYEVAAALAEKSKDSAKKMGSESISEPAA